MWGYLDADGTIHEPGTCASIVSVENIGCVAMVIVSHASFTVARRSSLVMKRPIHATTAAPPTGLGKRLAGNSSNTNEVVWMPESTPWDDDAAIPLPPPAAVAVVLELARTRGLERLRSRFRRLCAAASLQAPPLHAVERWLLLSKCCLLYTSDAADE